MTISILKSVETGNRKHPILGYASLITSVAFPIIILAMESAGMQDNTGYDGGLFLLVVSRIISFPENIIIYLIFTISFSLVSFFRKEEILPGILGFVIAGIFVMLILVGFILFGLQGLNSVW